MKIETRGKYPGVKVHLDPDEIQVITDYFDTVAGGVYQGPGHPADAIEALIEKLDKKIRALKEQEPTLLEERTPEAIAAILAKESEKAALQLKALQEGKSWKKVDPDALNAAMSKLVNKQ